VSRSLLERKKSFFDFFLAKKFEIDYVFFFEQQVFFLPTRVDLMDKANPVTSSGRQERVSRVDRRRFSFFDWRRLSFSRIARQRHTSASYPQLWITLFVTFWVDLSIKFNLLVGDYHG
jgi:hypothetical protein